VLSRRRISRSSVAFGANPIKYSGVGNKNVLLVVSLFSGYDSSNRPPVMAREALPYWLVNVPSDQWPAECPEFLINVNVKDRAILSTLDADYKRQSWPEVQQIISNDIKPTEAHST
jgi:hypothetical protein